MFQQLLSRYGKKLSKFKKSRLRKPRQKREFRFQPALECLEDRVLLCDAHVFGLDTRYPVSVARIENPGELGPWSAIGHIIRGDGGSGTGAMIGPNVFLTAAHNLYQRDSSGRVVYNAENNPGAVKVVLGRSGQTQFGVHTATGVRIPASWKSHTGTDRFTPVYDDYALVFLKGRPGDYTNWFDVAVYAQHDFVNRPLSSAGYPCDKSYGVMHVTYGPSSHATVETGGMGTIQFAPSDSSLDHKYVTWHPDWPTTGSIIDRLRIIAGIPKQSGFDIAQGQSGSPVWHEVVHSVGDVRQNVVGVLVGSSASGISATRITGTVYNQIATWIGATPPPRRGIVGPIVGEKYWPNLTDFDQWLDTSYNTFDGGSIRPGDSISGRLRLYNAGTADAGSAMVNIYASTDEEITADDHLLGSVQGPGLARFESADVDWSFSLPALPLGTYRIGWMIDADDAVSESVESDNSGVYESTITVPNTPPKAANDSYSTNEDTVLTIPAAGVLANDIEIDAGQTLQAVLLSLPEHGNIEFSDDGSFVYTPHANFHGTDSFTYSAADGQENSEPATVTITVAPLNDAPIAADDAFATDEDVKLTFDVRSNDTDIDGDPLDAVVVDGPLHGALHINADGSFRYDPDDNYYGEERITYYVNDGDADSSLATVYLTVNPVNDPPVARDDVYETSEDELLDVPPLMTLLLTGSGVLQNDKDVDNRSLHVVLMRPPQHGKLEWYSNRSEVRIPEIKVEGAFTYTPDPNFHGEDYFLYRAFDGTAYSQPAKVTINVAPVNDVPIAYDDSHTTNEDSPFVLDVRTNDADIDGDNLATELDTLPEHGALRKNPDGSYEYTPYANYHGDDQFTYYATDGTAKSDLATVTITVSPVNDAPVAADDSFVTREDESLIVVSRQTLLDALPRGFGVLANDKDVDDAALRAVLRSGPRHGSLKLNSDGTFTYTPNLNFNGSDSFVYYATDGAASSEPATVTIAVTPVNDAPVLEDQAFSIAEMSEWESLVGRVFATDIDRDDTLRFEIEGDTPFAIEPQTGVIRVREESGLDFEATPRFDLTVRVTDEQGLSDTAAVTIELTDIDELPLLRRSHGFRFTGNYYVGYMGREEKWFMDRRDRWFFLTPDGTLYRWEGKSFAASEAIMKIGTAAYTDPDSLFNAPVETPRQLQELLSELRSSHGFQFTGDYYRDYYGHLEKWFTNRDGNWYSLTPDGNLREWQGRNFDDGQVIAQADPLVYDDPELLFHAAVKLSGPMLETLGRLRQTHGFHFTGNYYFDYLGHREKWFKDRDSNWFFLTPDGQLRQWSGKNLANSRTIDRVDPVVYDDPQLLFQAELPAAPVPAYQLIRNGMSSDEVAAIMYGYAELVGRTSAYYAGSVWSVEHWSAVEWSIRVFFLNNQVTAVYGEG